MKSFKRKVYLDTVSLDEARHIIKKKVINRCIKLEEEWIDVQNALHRISGKAIFSKLSSPYYNAAAMDGIAVISKKTYKADLNHPIELIKDKDFVFVNTGDMIEAPYDAVIMIEDVIEMKKNSVTINKAAIEFQHIRPVGEDIVASEMVIPSHHQIRPVDISAMIAGGINQISVIKKALVSIIPTGDEIITHPEEMKTGKIIDSNSHFLYHRVIECGHHPVKKKPVKDNYDLIKEAVLKVVKESQMVLIVAGSSSGSKDYTASIIEELGEVFIHGIAIKPGKPVVVGMIDNKPVIGIPGYPVSTYIAFEQVVKPILDAFFYQKVKENPTVEATLTKKIYSSLKSLEFVRVKLGYVNNKLIATPLNRGAGVTMSLVRADGLLKINKKSEGYEANTSVQIELLKDINAIENSLVSIGSHDIILDYIGNLLIEKGVNTRLSSAHVGSFSGVLAMKRGECHIAPIHILDEKTGVYNKPVLKKYFNNHEVVLIKGLKREQGLMVRKDSDKLIQSIKDLIRDDITFINRQKGSGTRILLDHLLDKENIDSRIIKGYEFEVNTHMMVASSVFSKVVDCGLGVKSAAKIFDLDFIPIGFEEYDFLILKEVLDTKEIQDFIEVLKSKQFKDIVQALGGYKIVNIGEIYEGSI